MSYLLLNTKIYRHQKISMIISPLLSIIMFVVFKEECELKLNIIVYLIICLILRSLRFILMVFGKFYMEKLYVTQFKLLSCFGIFGIIFSLIVNFISYFLKFPEFIDKKEFLGQRLRNVFDCWGIINKWYFFGSVFFWFIENYLIWFCISRFSPNHYIVFRNISSILVILKELINKNGFNDYKTIISFFALFGIFICGLTFNEIIIIRIFKLDKYTAVEIDKRQREEFERNNIDIGIEETPNAYSDMSENTLASGNMSNNS